MFPMKTNLDLITETWDVWDNAAYFLIKIEEWVYYFIQKSDILSQHYIII